MVKRLDNLIGIFQNRRSTSPRTWLTTMDIVGDAYEYLMRHFATQRGKRKRQFGREPPHCQVIGFTEEHQGSHPRLRPHLRLELSSSQVGPRRQSSG